MDIFFLSPYQPWPLCSSFQLHPSPLMATATATPTPYFSPLMATASASTQLQWRVRVRTRARARAAAVAVVAEKVKLCHRRLQVNVASHLHLIGVSLCVESSSAA